MRLFVKGIISLLLSVILLPVELALIIVSWIGIFLTSMTGWMFNLLSAVLFSLCLLAKIVAHMPTDLFWQSMIFCFVMFILPHLAEWFISRIVDLRFWVGDIITRRI